MKKPKSTFLNTLINHFHTSKLEENEANSSENTTTYTRRKFLSDTTKTLTILGVGSLLPMIACNNSNDKKNDNHPNNPPSNSPKIVIIGGGIAGLNCAYQLKKQGISATIYEASNRLGGRILTHYNDSLQMGVFPEFGGDFIDSGHKDMRDLIEAFHLETIDLEKEQQEKNYIKDIYFFKGKKFSEKEVIQEFHKIVPKLEKDIESLGENYDTPAAETLDNTPLSEYIKQLSCADWLKELLTAAFVSEFGLDCDEQSTLNFLDMIDTDTSKGFKVYGDSDERFRIKAGNSKLIEAIHQNLDKESIKLAYKLVSIADYNQHQYKLIFENKEEIIADHVVLTLPFTLLREVKLDLQALTKEKKECIDTLGYGQNTKLVLGYEGMPWQDAPHHAMGYLFHKDIVNGWDSSYNKTPNNAFGAYIGYFGGAYSRKLAQASTLSTFAPASHVWKPQLPDNEVLKIVDELEKVFSGSKKKFQHKHVFVNWIDYPYTKGSYSCYKVGQWTSISGKEIEPIGNILFAGEHCSEEFQGYMNGGAETGRRAAEELIKKVNKVTNAG